jgi:hypothetical protein
MKMKYEELNFKIPIEADDYDECSAFVTQAISEIISQAVENGKNKIIINTNLKRGLPMENINKIAGPIIEAWAFEVFYDVLENSNNEFQLINVEAQEKLSRADIVLQFKRQRKIAELGITAEVDVKATAEDIVSSGKSPNITSFARIRCAYIEDPDYIFIILSLKHRVYSTKNSDNLMMDGIMEIVGHKVYDLKYVSSQDLNCNPALGYGQIQIKDINYVSIEKRTAWEFCQLLDRKYLNSNKRSFDNWLEIAKKFEWIKTDE